MMIFLLKMFLSASFSCVIMTSDIFPILLIQLGQYYVYKYYQGLYP